MTSYSSTLSLLRVGNSDFVLLPGEQGTIVPVGSRFNSLAVGGSLNCRHRVSEARGAVIVDSSLAHLLDKLRDFAVDCLEITNHIRHFAFWLSSSSLTLLSLAPGLRPSFKRLLVAICSLFCSADKALFSSFILYRCQRPQPDTTLRLLVLNSEILTVALGLALVVCIGGEHGQTIILEESYRFAIDFWLTILFHSTRIQNQNCLCFF